MGIKSQHVKSKWSRLSSKLINYQPTKPKDNISAISLIHLTFVSTSSTCIQYTFYIILIHKFKHLSVHLKVFIQYLCKPSLIWKLICFYSNERDTHRDWVSTWLSGGWLTGTSILYNTGLDTTSLCLLNSLSAKTEQRRPKRNSRRAYIYMYMTVYSNWQRAQIKIL